MIGRAAAVPLPKVFQVRLGSPLARVVETAADYLRAGSAALIAHRNSPPLDPVEAALDAYAASIATARRERLTQDLPVDVVERIFTLDFALEQLHQNFIDLARCGLNLRNRTPPPFARLPQGRSNHVNNRTQDRNALERAGFGSATWPRLDMRPGTWLKRKLSGFGPFSAAISSLAASTA